MTIQEACEYSDGGRVVVETTLAVRDGKTARQVDVVASDERTNSQEEGPGTVELKYEHWGGRDPAGPASVLKQAIEQED